MTAWTKSANPAAISSRLEKHRKGPGAFEGGYHDEHTVVLAGMLTFNASIPAVERRRIASQAAFEASKDGAITPESLKKHSDLLEAKYLRQPEVPYRLLTGVSIHRSASAPTTRLSNVTLTFGPRLSSGIRKARAQQQHLARPMLRYEVPSNYLEISAYVHARSVHAAAQAGFDAIDLVRASWNLSINRRAISRSSSGRPKPVNAILLLPFHTLHQQDGRLASESWWFDPSFAEAANVFSDDRKFDQLIQFDVKVRRKLTACPYRQDLQQALLRYVRALDSADLNDSFLRLWGVLEQLTATTRSSYDVTVRRAAFLFAERDYAAQVLSVIAAHRNGFVHAGSESPDVEALVYMLKRHVDSLLMFHIGNRFGFASLSDAGEFLDLPATSGALERQLTRLRDAQKFVSGP